MGKKKLMSDSKSDHSFEKKLQFYSKVKEAVTTLSAQKSISKKKSKQQRRQNKLKAYNLSSLLESLPEVKASKKKPSGENDSKLNCKSRQTLVLKERDRFSTVIKELSVQADPLFAIQQYLQKTQPVVEELPKKKVNKNGSKKKKKSKASTGLKSMEF